jgi:hypothetical protein
MPQPVLRSKALSGSAGASRTGAAGLQQRDTKSNNKGAAAAAPSLCQIPAQSIFKLST